MKPVLRFFILLLLAALPAAAQRIDVTRLNMRPLLQLHAVGADLIGASFQTDVFIHQSGFTVLAYAAQTGDARRVASGIASPQALMALNQALAGGQVGQQTGNCGGPAPDYVETYALTWYGKQRVRTIPAGGNYFDCPAPVVRIFNATCEFIWSVLGPAIEVCVPPNP